eukprot:708932-Hanusia_phi.AAC.1
MAKLRQGHGSYKELLKTICQNKLLCEDSLHDSSSSGDAGDVASDSKLQQASEEVEMFRDLSLVRTALVELQNNSKHARARQRDQLQQEPQNDVGGGAGPHARPA